MWCVDQSFAVRKDGGLNMLCDRGRICSVMCVFPHSKRTRRTPNTKAVAVCIEVATRPSTQSSPGATDAVKVYNRVTYHRKYP